MRKLIVNRKEIPVVHRYNPFLRTMNLRVNSYGQIVIITNYYDEYGEPDLFILKNVSFIQKELDRLKASTLPTFKNESHLWLLGKKYIVYRSKRIQHIVMKENGIAIPKKYRPREIGQYLRGILYKVLEPLFSEYRRKYNFESIEMKIVSTHDYWGMCSKQKRKQGIYFNLALVFLPIEIIEYVIVHELCHLKQMNHSKLFWQEVETIMPDAKRRKRMLKAYSLDWYLERLDIHGREYKR